MRIVLEYYPGVTELPPPPPELPPPPPELPPPPSEHLAHVLQSRELRKMAERLLAPPPGRPSRRGWSAVRRALILAAWVMGIALVVAVVVSVISALMQGPPNPF
jgi:hypothetical protein